MNSFQRFWNWMIQTYSANIQVRNWTRYSRFIGEDFNAIFRNNNVIVTLPSSRNITVSRQDFEQIFNVWADYLRGTVRRSEIRIDNARSKYIISILMEYTETFFR